MNAATALSLGQVSARLPGRPAKPTLLRWIREGVELPDGRVVRLKATRIGLKFWIDVDDLERFVAEQNEPVRL